MENDENFSISGQSSLILSKIQLASTLSEKDHFSLNLTITKNFKYLILMTAASHYDEGERKCAKENRGDFQPTLQRMVHEGGVVDNQL